MKTLNSDLWRAMCVCTALLPAAAVVAAPPYRYDHVVVVIYENHNYAQVLGNRTAAPFLNELADGGVSFTQFYAVTHPSQPNYLHLFSGDNQGIIDDAKPATYPWTTPNLGANLTAAGATFAGYSEDLPAIGDRDTTGVDVVVAGVTYKLYRRKHNPWANWQAATGAPLGLNQLSPPTNLRMLDFPGDFTQLPKVASVVPNEQNDMHDGSIRMGDDWLRANLGAYAQWARTHNSLLVVTFDEDDFSGPNKIPTVFYGAGLTPGTKNATTWTLHNLLRTLEDMHGAAHAARSALVRSINGVFPGDPPVLTARFQQGVNGYAGGADTTLRADAPTVDNSAAATLLADLDTGTGLPAQVLVRFENLFGASAGQVPADAVILSAKLILTTGSGANDISATLVAAHRMLAAWSATDTWDSLTAGISADDTEAVSTASFTQVPNILSAPVIFDVTGDVAAWLAGAANRGWALLPMGTDGWVAASSKSATASQRPRLEIAYTVPVAAGYAAWQLAKFGSGAGQAGSLAEDDPDGDGASNLLEYALNTHPLRAAPGDLPAMSDDGTHATLRFFRNLDASDITLTVQATDNLAAAFQPLATWTQAAGWAVSAGVSVEDNAGAVTLTDSAALSATPRRFLRVNVTRP